MAEAATPNERITGGKEAPSIRQSAVAKLGGEKVGAAGRSQFPRSTNPKGSVWKTTVPRANAARAYHTPKVQAGPYRSKYVSGREAYNERNTQFGGYKPGGVKAGAL